MKRTSVIVLAVCLTSVVLPLDFSGAAAATPAIARDLGGTPEQLAWIVNAFMLSLGSCALAAGALADLLGRKRVFVWGTAGFVITSAAVAIAPTVFVLDLIRVLQGIAAAATLSAGSAVLAQELAGAERLRAFSLLGTTFGLGLALGPSVGGMMLSVIGWRGVFLSAGAVGVVALALATPRLADSRDPEARGLDVPGTAAFTATLALFTYGLLTLPEHARATSAAIFGAAALGLAMFVAIELGSPRPMLDLRLFRDRRFVAVQLLPVATACSYAVLLIVLPLRFIGVEHRSETMSGALMLVLSAPMLVVPRATAWLATRISPFGLSFAGTSVAACGLLWLAHAGSPPIGPMLVIGLGSAMPWGLMDGLAVSVVPTSRAGMAAGVFSTARVASEGLVMAAAVRHVDDFARLATVLAAATLIAGGAALVAGRRHTA